MRLLAIPSAADALPRPALHPVLACGLLAASLDMALAFAWWLPRGTSPVQVLQSIAAWFAGPAAYAGGAATALAGGLLYVGLMCALAAGYRGLARSLPLLRRHPLPCGALYGALAYLLVFGALVPALTRHTAFAGSAGWNAVCLLAYAFLIGVPCACFARLPARRAAG